MEHFFILSTELPGPLPEARRGGQSRKKVWRKNFSVSSGMCGAALKFSALNSSAPHFSDNVFFFGRKKNVQEEADLVPLRGGFLSGIPVMS